MTAWTVALDFDRIPDTPDPRRKWAAFSRRCSA